MLKLLSRFLPVVVLAAGGACVLAADRLESMGADRWVVLFSQTGTANERNLEKARLFLPALKLFGAELALASFVLLRYRNRVSRFLLFFFSHLTTRQRSVFALYWVYGAVTGLMINFVAVSVAGKLVHNWNRARTQIVERDLGEEAEVLRALRTSTGEEARILIQTANSIKYLLNYELHPRRFYFYTYEGKTAPPPAWMNQHRIQWVLTISDSDARQFSLVRAGPP
ncbi:MAG: hypothetical protein AB1898_12870 [Acidobacteriota bacterium]